MIVRCGAWKKASITTKVSLGRTRTRQKWLSSPPAVENSIKHESGLAVGVLRRRSLSSASLEAPEQARNQKRDRDREFVISVLESATTKRDAKVYLQTFGPILASGALFNRPDPTSPARKPRFIQDLLTWPLPDAPRALRVAVVKFRLPQLWDDAVLNGVAKTFTQLRDLGLLSLIVVDCGVDAIAGSQSTRQILTAQVDRIATAIRRRGDSHGPSIVRDAISKAMTRKVNTGKAGAVVIDFWVDMEDAIMSPLQSAQLIVMPAMAISETGAREVVNANELVSALVMFLAGLQLNQSTEDAKVEVTMKAFVDRIIVIDPLGGIPSQKRGHAANVLINLEDEFDEIQGFLALATKTSNDLRATAEGHLENLRLAKDTLSVLPSMSSVLITTPCEAANLKPASGQSRGADANLAYGLPFGKVATRRAQNPLIHNLLTDRPVYSSSLPITRIKSETPRMPTTTLARRGLPVTIYPDPHKTPWTPPKPGDPWLKLMDNCIDLPKLVHLINDSFDRKLDVKNYLRRMDDCLAGIIIAGEYEGAAILTWERPFGMDEETAYRRGRHVPYLDKFAVLKRNQGAGGVADIVFNAMVRDCFPSGVCWRSRKNNPVNKWYFERANGVWKLKDSNWAMFWTTPDLALEEQTLKGYEEVCRRVIPSWTDGKIDDQLKNAI